MKINESKIEIEISVTLIDIITVFMVANAVKYIMNSKNNKEEK